MAQNKKAATREGAAQIKTRRQCNESGVISQRGRWRFGGPGAAPVDFSVVRGAWLLSKDLIWPAILWNDGRCWAYLHDMTPTAVQHVLELLRDAELERSHPHGTLVGW
jgi:hypothetical protein